jgi:hypothetical protein
MIFEKLSLIAEEGESTSTIKSELKIPLPTNKEIVFPFTQKRGYYQINSDNLSIHHCEAGAGLIAQLSNINPLAYDFLEIEVAANPPFDAKQLTVLCPRPSENLSEPFSWAGKASGLSVSLTNINSQQASVSPANPSTTSPDIPIAELEYKTYRIPLSRYWRWFTNGPISNLWLEFPAAQSIFIRNIRLVSDKSIVPKLSVTELQPNNTIAYKSDNRGVYQIYKNGPGLSLEIDASQIKNCNGIKIELSKPNYFFENFDYTSEQAVLSTTTFNETSKTFFIDTNLCPGPGYYQIRVAGINTEGHLEGEWSDPLTIKF